jgi:hypothetical protein
MTDIESWDSHPTVPFVVCKFLRAVCNDSVEIDLKAEDYSAKHSLFHKSEILYAREDDHAEAVRIFLALSTSRRRRTIWGLAAAICHTRLA